MLRREVLITLKWSMAPDFVECLKASA